MLLIWFLLVAIMITAYVVLDGFDLGAGVLHLFIARTDEERRLVIRTMARCGTGMKCGCWPAAGRCISLFRCYTHPGLADFIFR